MLPLADLKVLDLTVARSGPTAVRQLADWGASVIRIEPPTGSDLMSPSDSDYINLHRNKRAIRLNLKSAQGRELFYRLSDNADVVIENFRPQVKAALGVDYATLSARNPRLVYGSISGFGQDGPYATRGGLDQVLQGMGGLMSITGHADSGPMRAGIAVADLSAGHHLAFGVLAAIHERQTSGLGQWVQASLLESMIVMLDFQAVRWTADRDIPLQTGNEHPNRVPMGAYRTSDGFINIAASYGRLWERLAQVLADESLLTDPDYETDEARVVNRDALNERIEKTTATRTTQEWLTLMDAAGIPAGPIYHIDEVFQDPQVQHLAMTWTFEHPVRGGTTVLRPPVTMSRTPAHPRTASPMPGQHQRQILAELGISEEEQAALAADGVI